MSARTKNDRRGPTLSLVLWDPDRSSAELREIAASAADDTGMPVSAEAGPGSGLARVNVWAGTLGLGLPGDRAEDWAPLGLALGAVVRTVRPALALSAPEWGLDSLDELDEDEDVPGLACGWVRVDGRDADREQRYRTLADRGVVHPVWDGFAWAAEGSTSLDGEAAGSTSRVSGAVRRAWSG